MPRFVALLRGINVGKAKRVPMAELRELLTSLGYRNVRTLLNSGNAVFDSTARSAAAQATRIRAAIAERMNLEVPVIVKSAEDIAAACAENTLLGKATDHARLLAAFAGREEDLRALEALAPLVEPPERFLVGKHAAYLWCPTASGEPRHRSAGKVGRAATAGNWATVTKIAPCCKSTRRRVERHELDTRSRGGLAGGVALARRHCAVLRARSGLTDTRLQSAKFLAVFSAEPCPG
jgi:uncharacterized protein (DUF1697 family)